MSKRIQIRCFSDRMVGINCCTDLKVLRCLPHRSQSTSVFAAPISKYFGVSQPSDQEKQGSSGFRSCQRMLSFRMQDPRNISALKPKKVVKKAANPIPIYPKQRSPMMHTNGVQRTPIMQPNGVQRTIGGAKQKATPTKRGLKNAGSSQLSNTGSHLTGPGSAEDYRVLRRRYLMLEEESFSLDKELAETEAESRSLEQEKAALLDQLVVLEGLVSPPGNGAHHGRM